MQPSLDNLRTVGYTDGQKGLKACRNVNFIRKVNFERIEHINYSAHQTDIKLNSAFWVMDAV